MLGQFAQANCLYIHAAVKRTVNRPEEQYIFGLISLQVGAGCLNNRGETPRNQSKKERKNMEKKRMNDKGFSLVELIIVIAIMAILIGLLAPQYLKFVERSKKSADRDTVDQIIRTVQLDYADPESTTNVEGAKITLTPTGAATVTEATGTNLGTVLSNFGLNTADMKLKSSKWHEGTASGANVTAIVITFSYSGESVTATVTANTGTQAPVDDSGTSITGKTSATPTP